MGDFGKERIVSLITGREIFQWLINLKKREYDDSDTLTVDGRPMKVFKETQKDLGIYSRNEYRRTLYSFFNFCACGRLLSNHSRHRQAGLPCCIVFNMRFRGFVFKRNASRNRKRQSKNGRYDSPKRRFL